MTCCTLGNGSFFDSILDVSQGFSIQTVFFLFCDPDGNIFAGHWNDEILSMGGGGVDEMFKEYDFEIRNFVMWPPYEKIFWGYKLVWCIIYPHHSAF